MFFILLKFSVIFVLSLYIRIVFLLNYQKKSDKFLIWYINMLEKGNSDFMNIYIKKKKRLLLIKIKMYA